MKDECLICSKPATKLVVQPGVSPWAACTEHHFCKYVVPIADVSYYDADGVAFHQASYSACKVELVSSNVFKAFDVASSFPEPEPPSEEGSQ